VLGRPWHRLEDNIKMDLQGIGWWEATSGLMDQDRVRRWALVYVVMNLQVPKNAEKFLTVCGIATFSRWTVLHGVSFVCLFSLKNKKRYRAEIMIVLLYILS
jgi:hypothetical protein